MNTRPEPTLFVAIGSSTRRRIEAAVEQLLALLDQLDGDADLEASNDDEPSLGWPNDRTGSGSRESDDGDTGDDREFDDADDEDSHDAEADDADLEPDEDGEDSELVERIWRDAQVI